MTGLIIHQGELIALKNAVELWADARTDADSQRRADLLRDKATVVLGFFDYVNIHPLSVTSSCVKDWRDHLEGRGLATTTIYAMVSRLSSFYTWLMSDPDFAAQIRTNPVELARPKAPRAYQGEKTKALTDYEMRALLNVVKARRDVIGKRDYALLRLYFATGLRRAEIIGLRWKDFQVEAVATITTLNKGGEWQTRQIRDEATVQAVFDYLEASGRLATIQDDDPLWTSHDRANVKPGAPLTSHAFAKNLKSYAAQAGLGHIHLHQTRHTFARIVAEESGSLVDTQAALGHKDADTTRVYVERVGVKQDKSSGYMADRMDG